MGTMEATTTTTMEATNTTTGTMKATNTTMMVAIPMGTNHNYGSNGNSYGNQWMEPMPMGTMEAAHGTKPNRTYKWVQQRWMQA